MNSMTKLALRKIAAAYGAPAAATQRVRPPKPPVDNPFEPNIPTTDNPFAEFFKDLRNKPAKGDSDAPDYALSMWELIKRYKNRRAGQGNGTTPSGTPSAPPQGNSL